VKVRFDNNTVASNDSMPGRVLFDTLVRQQQRAAGGLHPSGSEWYVPTGHELQLPAGGLCDPGTHGQCAAVFTKTDRNGGSVDTVPPRNALHPVLGSGDEGDVFWQTARSYHDGQALRDPLIQLMPSMSQNTYRSCPAGAQTTGTSVVGATGPTTNSSGLTLHPTGANIGKEATRVRARPGFTHQYSTARGTHRDCAAAVHQQKRQRAG